MGLKIWRRILSLLVPAVAGLGMSAASAAPVAMVAERWETAGLARFLEQDGRQAVRLGAETGQPLRGGQAALRGSDFSTGVIEFDLLVPGHRDFVGFLFRADEAGNAEYFYIRPHQSGNPDSTQYTPVVNGMPAWQIFSGDGFTSAVRFTPGRWMRVRADIYERSARISIDGATALVIPHLKGGTRTGQIGLTAVGGAFFSNLDIQPIAGHADPSPAPPPPPLPAGSVTAWQVSPAMAEADALARAGRRDWTGIAWQNVPTESHGIANLSRAGPNGEGRVTYVARFMVRSAAARTTAMEFGFSDSVRIFLNGRPLYGGSDVQASRDYRFLGIVGFWDSLFLPLEAGPNEVTFVVTDARDGGVAAAARFEADAEVVIEPVPVG